MLPNKASRLAWQIGTQRLLKLRFFLTCLGKVTIQIQRSLQKKALYIIIYENSRIGKAAETAELFASF